MMRVSDRASRQGGTVTVAAPTVVIRDGIPRDFVAITRVLTVAFGRTPVACWLDPDPGVRQRHAVEYISALVARTVTSGIVRVAVSGGEIVGAALWAPHRTSMLSALTALPARPHVAEPDAGDRRRLLEDAARVHLPWVAHHQLLYLGVRPDRQSEGIGSYLLIGHHDLLHVTNTPAYLVADDDRIRDWFERHGYTPIGPPELLPGGVPVWPMWREPAPTGL